MEQTKIITAYELLEKQKDTGKRNHKFYKEIEGYWMVYCEETTGRFCTSLWIKGIYPRQQCPCCGKIIEPKHLNTMKL